MSDAEIFLLILLNLHSRTGPGEDLNGGCITSCPETEPTPKPSLQIHLNKMADEVQACHKTEMAGKHSA